MSRGQFNQTQRERLLMPIDGFRVQDLDGQSHLAAWDVAAHLTRVFGFEGWDKEVLSLELVYEHVGTREVGHRQNCNRRGECNCRTRVVPACSVGYRCTMRLTIRDLGGEVVRVIEDAAMGTATNQRDLGDAHDLALKSAVSYALKRCAKDLGDQFGLSLYNKGQESACVQVVFPYQTQDAPDLKVNVVADGISEGDEGFGPNRGEGRGEAVQPAEQPAQEPEPQTEPREVAEPVEDGDPGAPVEVHPEPVREPQPAQRQERPKPEPTPPPERPARPEISEEQAQDWYGEICSATVVNGETADGEPRSVRQIWQEIDRHGALDVTVLDLRSEKPMALREVMVRQVSEIETGQVGVA